MYCAHESKINEPLVLDINIPAILTKNRKIGVFLLKALVASLINMVSYRKVRYTKNCWYIQNFLKPDP